MISGLNPSKADVPDIDDINPNQFDDVNVSETFEQTEFASFFQSRIGKTLAETNLKLQEENTCITFDCSWDDENGLGISFMDEKIIEVGYQDIAI